MILDNILDPLVIFEAGEKDEFGRKYYFGYTKFRHRQPDRHPVQTNPVVFYLGQWKRKVKDGSTRTFWCGIAIDYLDDEQLAALKANAPEILKKRRLYDRYWAGKRLLPDVFRRYYRTYRADRIENVVKGRFLVLKVTDGDREEAKELAQQDGEDFDKLPEKKQAQYVEKAIIKRGKTDLKDQEDAALERETEMQPKPEPKPQPSRKRPKPVVKPTPKPKPKPKPRTMDPSELEIMPTPPKPKPSKFKPIQRAPIQPPTPETPVEPPPQPKPPRSIRSSKHGMIKPKPENVEPRPEDQGGE